MIGFLFTDLLDMLESRYGIAFTQQIVDGANLTNKGAFTAVGYYNRQDLDSLLESIMAALGGTRKEWLFSLGQYMSEAIIRRNPEFYKAVKNLPDCLFGVNKLAQAKVNTLYPTARLPTFSTRIVDEHTIEFLYASPNCLGDLTLGWVSGNAIHFGEKVAISQELLVEDGSQVLFTIKRLSI